MGRCGPLDSTAELSEWVVMGTQFVNPGNPVFLSLYAKPGNHVTFLSIP
jgi:hypothetical protein